MDYVTWFDQKPSHPAPPQAITEKRALIDRLWQQRDKILEKHIDKNVFMSEDRQTRRELAAIDKQIEAAEKDLARIRAEMAAAHRKGCRVT